MEKTERTERTSYQTLDIKYPAGTASGKYTDPADLDTHYDYCDGVQVFEILNGGVPNYQIGIDDKNTFYNTLVNKNDYMSGVGVDPDHRYKSIAIPVVSGNKINVNSFFPTALVSDVYYQVVFRLKRNIVRK